MTRTRGNLPSRRFQIPSINSSHHVRDGFSFARDTAAGFRICVCVGVRMVQGESYEQFVGKFKPKKTTDDCYTPEVMEVA